jgi:hypothetical protein
LGCPLNCCYFTLKFRGSPTSDQRIPQNNGDHEILSTYRLWQSKTSYGGTHEEGLAGSGQGNAAAGLGFTAMSLLILNAYLRDGFGAWIYSSYYKQLLLLVAMMYIDNTDLIHWSSQPSCNPSKLIAAAQTVTYVWGLAIARGAAMKLDKCYAY